MKKCKFCNKVLPKEKPYNVFCDQSCATKLNNKLYPKRKGTAKKIKLMCKWCKKSFERLIRSGGRKRLFCSTECYNELRKNDYISRWKRGELTGLQPTRKVVTKPIKKYLREKFGNKCCLCGWNKINSFTKKVPLVADHIDGDCTNNAEENLRLICWNCDSLNKTFGAGNRGNGRSTK